MYRSLARQVRINSLPRSVRMYSTPPSDEYEQKIFKILEQSFDPRALEVKDISGGCGTMFSIILASEKFKGLNTVKQHRLVNEALKSEISKWHGFQLKTKAA